MLRARCSRSRTGLVERRPYGAPIVQLENDVADVIRDQRVMRIVDVLRFVRPLVIVTVQSSEEECDRDALFRVINVIAAAIDAAGNGEWSLTRGSSVLGGSTRGNVGIRRPVRSRCERRVLVDWG